MPGSSHLSHPRTLRLRLACNLAEVRMAAQMARAFLAEQGCAEKELMDYELALVEACNNAIKYVADGGRQKPVLMEVLCDPHEVELRITDHTPGFEWPEKAMLPDPESESGRGLYLIRALMDYANYLRSPGENVLVLKKARKSQR